MLKLQPTQWLKAQKQLLKPLKALQTQWLKVLKALLLLQLTPLKALQTLLPLRLLNKLNAFQKKRAVPQGAALFLCPQHMCGAGSEWLHSALELDQPPAP